MNDDTAPVQATSEQISALVRRLDESAERWRRIGRLTGGSDGAECVRLAARLSALANIARSKRYAHLFLADVLQRSSRRPTVRYADEIIESFPGQKIPGYQE